MCPQNLSYGVTNRQSSLENYILNRRLRAENNGRAATRCAWDSAKQSGSPCLLLQAVPKRGLGCPIITAFCDAGRCLSAPRSNTTLLRGGDTRQLHRIPRNDPYIRRQ